LQEKAALMNFITITRQIHGEILPLISLAWDGGYWHAFTLLQGNESL